MSHEFKTPSEIRAHALTRVEGNGHNWFERGAMRWFKTRLLRGLYNGANGRFYFVTRDGQVRAVKRYPCSDTCTHDDAASPGHQQRVKEQSAAVARAALGMPEDHVAAVAKEVGAKTGREVSSFRLGYERGAAAMRAACLEAIQDEKDEIGLTDYQRDRLKAAIEGAVP